MSDTSSNGRSDNLTRLGGFEILEQIGEGGMGVVYRARQTSLERVVALKVLNSRLAQDSKYINSFLREARAAGRLNHSNIVHVHDVGEASGSYYYAMEFVDGETLAKWVKREGALPEQMTLEIALCVIAALKHAWDREQLIHRDIKPENIMVDREGNVKLCDLGLSKNFGETTTMSLSGQAFGTPQYMSPEQARAEKQMDCRTDIYSMGMTIWFGLTGEIPFHGGSPALIMARQLTEQLDDPRDIVETTSPYICRVLEKMLAKEAADRYASWDEVMRDLLLAREGRAPEIPLIFNGTSSMRREVLWQPGMKRGARKPQEETGQAEEPSSEESASVKTLKMPNAPTFDTTEESPTVEPIAPIPSERIRREVVEVSLHEVQPRRPAPPSPAPPPQRSSKAPLLITLAAMLVVFLGAMGVFFYMRSSANSPAARLVEIEEYAKQSPTHLMEIEARLRKFIAEFPNTPQSNQASVMLTSVIEERSRFTPLSVAEQERRRQEQEEALRRYNEVLAFAQNNPDDKAALAAQLQEIIAQHPNAPAAADARNRLAQLGVSPNTGITNLERLAEGEPAGELLQTYRGHMDEVRCVAMTSDGDHVLTGSRDATLKLWNTVTGDEVRTFRGHTAGVMSVAISPDDRLAASGAEDNTVIVWNIATGEAVKTLQGHDGAVRSVAFSPDGRLIASASWDRTITIWDVKTGKAIQTLRGHTDKVNTVAFTPGGRQVLSGGDDKLMKLWDINTGRELSSVEAHTAGGVWMVGVSPDGQSFLSAVGSRWRWPASYIIRFWDVATNKESWRTPKHSTHFRSMALSRDGAFLLAGNSDGSVKLWSTTTKQEVRTILAHPASVEGVCFSPDHRFAVSASSDKTAKLWKLSDDEKPPVIAAPTPSLPPLPTPQKPPKVEDTAKLAQEKADAIALATALEAANDFRVSFTGKLSKRNYTAAAKLAQDTLTNPTIAPLRDTISECESTAKQLASFWNMLPTYTANLKGKNVTILGKNGNFGGISKGEIELEQQIGGGVAVIGVSLKELSVDDIVMLVGENSSDKEKTMDLAWFHFAEGKMEQALSRLGALEQSGVNTAVPRKLMDWLTNDPREVAAQELLTKVRALVANKQWQAARKPFDLLRSRYATTQTFTAAEPELSQIEEELAFNLTTGTLTPGEVIRIFAGHKDAVVSVSFSPDGRFILSASLDRVVKLWELASGRELRSFSGIEDPRSLAFSPDGRHLITNERHGKTRFYNLQTGAEAATFVRTPIFSPDKQRFVIRYFSRPTGSDRDDLCFKIYDAASLKEIGDFRHGTDNRINTAATSAGAYPVAITPDGRFAVSAMGNTLKFWNLEKGQAIREMVGQDEYVEQIAVSPDARLAVAWGRGPIKLWDLVSGKHLWVYRDSNTHQANCEFTPDGKHISLLDARRKVLLSVRTGEVVETVPVTKRTWDNITTSPDGRHGLVRSGNSFKLVDVVSGRELRPFNGHTGVVTSVSFSPDGRFIISGSGDRTVRLWKVAPNLPPAQP